MQTYRLEQLFKQPGLIHLSYTIIKYLDIDFIESLIFSPILNQNKQSINDNMNKVQNDKQRGESYFYELIKKEYYIKNHMNRVDRSLYYNFYEDQLFLNIEKKFIQHIITKQTLSKLYSQKNYQIQLINSIKSNSQNEIISNQQKKKHPLKLSSSLTLTNCLDLFNCIINQLSTEMQNNQEQIEQIKRIFLDPSLPLPKMKRQNQGIYCNSPFQLFLVGLRFDHDNFDSFTIFESLQQYLRDNEQQLLKSFFEIQRDKYLSSLAYQNLHLVRYTAYEVTGQNYNQIKLNSHTLHNIIVSLFALTDVYVTSIKIYIQNINDPLYKFIELMSRYSIFRSFIMEVQENFGFLFQMYDTLYSDSIRDTVSNKPRFCFWRPAMSKWHQKMNGIHEQTNQVYFMMLTQMRQENLSGIFQKYPLLKQSEITIKNNLEMNDFLDKLKEKISFCPQSTQDSSCNNLKNHPQNSQMKVFFQQNCQLSELLTCEYIQYMIDLSIDQFQVHWCGHSQQTLDINYMKFHQDFIQYNKDYNESLYKCLNKGSNNRLGLKIMNILMQEQINFLQEKNIKPLTLKSLIDEVNKQFFNQNPQDIQNKQTKENTLLQDYKIIPVNMDFKFKDQNLKYFNQKAKIIKSLDQQDKYYFSIPPLLSVEEMLIKSIDTTDSQNYYKNGNRNNNDNNQHQNSFQYVSDGEDEEDVEGRNKKQRNNKEEAEIDFVLERDIVKQVENKKFIHNLKRTNSSQQNNQQLSPKISFLSSQSVVKSLNSSNSTQNSTISSSQQNNKIQVQQQNDYQNNQMTQKSYQK